MLCDTVLTFTGIFPEQLSSAGFDRMPTAAD